MTKDEDYDALSQKHLASLKRDTRVSFEDATVRATHKVMAEFNPDWDEKAVLVEEMQRMAKRIEELEQKVAEQEPLAYRPGVLTNFCSRCGKRLMSALGPVSIHTCCPPNGYPDTLDIMSTLRPRTFDDYGNKLP
jgi:hypothetical protein